MEQAYVTLDALPGDGPGAPDNPTPSGTPSGAAAAPTSGAPAGPDLSAQIAAMEQRASRHVQQLHGSQEEVRRLTDQIRAIEQRLSQPATPAPPPQTPAPKVKLSEAIRALELHDDSSLLDTWQQHLETPATGLSRDDVRQLVQESQGQQSTKLTLQQAVTQRHPELVSDPQFATDVGTRYQALLNDPLAATLYPQDQQYLVREPTTGLEYDMRVLLQAANEAKAQRGTTRPATPTLGVPGGSGSGGAGPRGPIIPRQMVEANGILANPAVQAVLRNLGWGATTREQATHMEKHLSPQAKQRWQRGQI